MGKTILVVGKNSPDGKKIADGFAFTGRQVVLSSNNISESFEEEISAEEKKASLDAYDEAKSIEAKSGMCTFEWNRASPVSARTLILQTENTYGKMDEVALFFDEEWYASHSDKIDSEQISRTSDEMIVGYQYLAMEALARFEKKNSSEPGSLVFLLKEGPSVFDAIKTPGIRNGMRALSSPVVASASAAFSAFAENMAALYGDSPFVNIILVRSEKTSESDSTDEALGKWLGNYLEGVETQKTKLTAKKSCQWIKPGAKPGAGTLSSIFKR